jgi:uncharacterized protein YndB with AHSA1/START domain
MGMTLHSLEMDARTGGSYHLDFGDGADFYGTYLEVTPHSRIVWTNDEDGENSSVTTVTFEDQDGKTLVTLVMSGLEREADRDSFLEGVPGYLDGVQRTAERRAREAWSQPPSLG